MTNLTSRSSFRHRSVVIYHVRIKSRRIVQGICKILEVFLEEYKGYGLYPESANHNKNHLFLSSAEMF